MGNVLSSSDPSLVMNEKKRNEGNENEKEKEIEKKTLPSKVRPLF